MPEDRFILLEPGAARAHGVEHGEGVGGGVQSSTTRPWPVAQRAIRSSMMRLLSAAAGVDWARGSGPGPSPSFMSAW